MFYISHKDDGIVSSVCSSYRDDRGMLTDGDDKFLKNEAVAWKEAWMKHEGSLAIDKETQTFCAEILAKMKTENDKRCEIYKHGVDLANYQNIYFECLMSCIVRLLKFDQNELKDMIEWWLFESVEKKIYFKNGEVRDVETPEGLVDFFVETYTTSD